MANKAKRQKARSQPKQTQRAQPGAVAASAAPIAITPAKPAPTSSSVTASATSAALLPDADMSRTLSTDSRSIRSVSSVTAVSPSLSNAQSTFTSADSSPHTPPHNTAAELLRAQIAHSQAQSRSPTHSEDRTPRKLVKGRPRVSSTGTFTQPHLPSDDQTDDDEHQVHSHDFENTASEQEHSPVIPPAPLTRHDIDQAIPSMSDSLLTVASEHVESVTATAPSMQTERFWKRYPKSAIRLPFAVASRLPVIGSFVPVPFAGNDVGSAGLPSPARAARERETTKDSALEAEADQPAIDERDEHGIVFKTVEIGIGVGLAGVLIAGVGASIAIDKVRSFVFRRPNNKAITES